MKLYKTTFISTDGSPKAKWSGSQAEASSDRAGLKREGAKEVKTEPIDFSPQKSGIIGLLNTHT